MDMKRPFEKCVYRVVGGLRVHSDFVDKVLRTRNFALLSEQNNSMHCQGSYVRTLQTYMNIKFDTSTFCISFKMCES